MFRIRILSLLFVVVSFAAACAQRDAASGDTAKADSVEATVTVVAEGLNHPWAMVFLPDGRLLVTERNTGHLRFVSLDGQVSEPIKGAPTVFAKGQGGMLDLALDPGFEENRLVYFSYSDPGEGNTATTVLSRGRLTGDSLEDVHQIFTQKPYLAGSKHFGGRIVFDPEGHIFFTLGERFQFDPAQELSNHLGTVVRINPDGSVPPQNPFVDQGDAEPEIWSYGHRNIEAAAIHPDTGRLWIAEMGPFGGDELNQPEAGENYGWPVVSWGRHYDMEDIPDPPTRPEFADAVKQWSPVISPSGMIFYTGDAFPQWQNNIFIGSLSAQAVVRLVLQGDEVVEEERIPLSSRIRDVCQGPDGFIYLLTDQDNGKLIRLSPQSD